MNLIPNFDLSKLNTLGLPSRAHHGATLSERTQIAEIARLADAAGLPLHIVGGGSNLVLRENLQSVVGLMATKGRDIDRAGDGTAMVTAQAGEDWSEFVAWTVEQGVGGLENLAGIPGTVGAAPVQNIGAYGVELSDRLHALTVWDRVDHVERRFERDDCQFSYRQSMLKRSANRFIVLDVTFALPQAWTPVLSYPGLDTLPADADAKTILERVVSVRRAKLPDWRVLGNAGSFFHNPVVHPSVADTIDGVPRYPQADGSVKLSAAWLIEKSGLKGYRSGPAGIYDQHALIVVNHGGATYSDVARLSAHVRQSVQDRFGIALVQEPIEL